MWLQLEFIRYASCGDASRGDCSRSTEEMEDRFLFDGGDSTEKNQNENRATTARSHKRINNLFIINRKPTLEMGKFMKAFQC